MKKIIKTILPLFLVAAICIGGSVALLAAKTNKVTNTFEAIYTGVEIQEPSWDPSAPHIYSAGETFAKDPQIYNSGNEEAYVYMSVFIPYVTTGYYRNSYQGYSRASSTPDHSPYSYLIDYDNWIDFWFTDAPSTITVEYNGETLIGNMMVYAYKKPIKSGETTTPLFNQMTFINYDADVENALEDDEKAGNGSGSDVLGKELPIIVQSYAITVDVVETMAQKSDETGVPWNYGSVMGWTYLIEQLEEEYEGSSEQPEILSYKNVENGYFSLDISDADNSYVETVDIYTYAGEYLDYEFFNSLLLDLGYVEQFESEDEMYDAFSQNVVSPWYGIYGYWGDWEYCTVKDDLAKVHVLFYENGEQTSSKTLPFKNGTAITNETIEQKLAEKGVNVDVSGIEINETAVNGQDYTLTIDLTDGSSDITTDDSATTS